MKKYFYFLLLSLIANAVFAVDYAWDGGAGSTDFWAPGNWNPDRATMLWDDILKIESTTLTDVNCTLTGQNMAGGRWQFASVQGANYNMVIRGTGSLALSRCDGLSFADPIPGTSSTTVGNVDFRSGTIYVTGDGGNPAVPGANGSFRIAPRGEANMKIGADANLCMLGGADIFVAGVYKPTEINRGTLTVAGTINLNGSEFNVVRPGAYGPTVSDGAVVGKLILEPTGVITGLGSIYIAHDTNMIGILDVNTGTTLDISNSSRKINLINVAHFGKGTVNVKSGASLLVKSGNFMTTMPGSLKRPVATINVANNGSLKYLDSTMVFSDINPEDHNNYASSFLNIAAGGNVTGRSTLGAEGRNTVFNLNLAGNMTMSNYLYLADSGTATANFDAGSVFTGSKITGARKPSAIATINSRGNVTLTSTYIAATAGTGIVNVLDGSIASDDMLAADGNTGANGTINISGGTVSPQDFVAANNTRQNGSGTINISGGTVNVPAYVLGGAGEPNTTGTINISGGTLNTHNTRISNYKTYGYLNITGGEFTGDNFTTLAERGNAQMTMSGGHMAINRLVIANIGMTDSTSRAAVGSATFSGGRADIYSRICIAQEAGSTGTLTVTGTADVNMSNEDFENTSVGIMAGLVPNFSNPDYASPYVAFGDATFVMEGSQAKVRTPYLTIGGEVFVPFDYVYRSSGPARFVVKLDGVHGVGKGIRAYQTVWLNDGPAANTGVVPSFVGASVVGIYNIIKCDGDIIIDDSYTGNLLLNSPGWSYKVVDAGAEKRFKLLYCDKGDNTCLVDLKCFATLAAQWVDGNADGYDLAYLANNWLKRFNEF